MATHSEPVAYREIPEYPDFARDYCEGVASVLAFFPHNPHDPSTLIHHLESLASRSYPRREITTLLTEQNRAWGAPTVVLDNIRRLEDPRSVAVLTGQQTGLFGGPLFTLYKALSTVVLSRWIEATHHVPCVPIFWMVSEDHDLEEACRVGVLDPDHQIHILQYDHREAVPETLPATLRLKKIPEALEELSRLLPPAPFRDEALTALTSCYTPGETLASAFARWMHRLFGRHGLILLDASSPRLKEMGVSLLTREIAEAPRTTTSIEEAGRRMQAAGYPPQLTLRPASVNLFLLDHDRRWIVWEGTGFRIKGESRLRSREELLELAETSPERFSPNVALRPLLQDSLLPTAAYIAGGAEICYFAELTPLYRSLDIPMPPILPRASLTLSDSRSASFLSRHGLTLADLTQEPEALFTTLLRRHLPPEVEKEIHGLGEEISQLFHRLAEIALQVDVTLRPSVGQAEGAVRGQIAQIEKKLLQALKRRQGELRSQIVRVRETLRPRGKLQERQLCALPLLTRYGWSLTDALWEIIEVPGWRHQLISLQPEGAGERREP